MATKQSSSYPLPGVTLPNVNYGQYSQPKRSTVIPPASAMVNRLQQGQEQQDELERQRLIKEENEKKEQQAIIENMQRVQTNADLWNLEQMSNMNTIPQTSAIDDQLQGVLHKRLDIATQAQVYLKTQFGDKEKRKSAQKAINDYYDLLTLTKTTATNFGALGSYWKEKAPTIGSAITIIGNDENEIANNQYFVNALGGVYDDARFEMMYDQATNDIMIKVSGYEHDLVDGKMVQGAYREKIMSARAFNARTGEGKDFGFVSEVPQIVNETIKKLYPKVKTPEGDGLGILNDKGVIADKYWSEEEVTTSNLNKGYIATSLSKQLNVDLLRKDMLGLLRQKIGGVVSTGPQQVANFWNIDLKKLNEGFANSYQELLPDDKVMAEALFQEVLKSLTDYDGITKDDDGNIFMETNRSISQGKTFEPPKKPEQFRYDDVQAAVLTIGEAGNRKTSVIETLQKFSPTKRYMTKDMMYKGLLNQIHPDAKALQQTTSYEEMFKIDHGDNWEEEYRKWFNDQNFKDGLYVIDSGGKPNYAGNYDFDSHEDTLNFILNQLPTAERKLYQNTNIRVEAKKLDWMKKNPKKEGESDADYAKRMNKALKL